MTTRTTVDPASAAPANPAADVNTGCRGGVQLDADGRTIVDPDTARWVLAHVLPSRVARNPLAGTHRPGLAGLCPCWQAPCYQCAHRRHHLCTDREQGFTPRPHPETYIVAHSGSALTEAPLWRATGAPCAFRCACECADTPEPTPDDEPDDDTGAPMTTPAPVPTVDPVSAAWILAHVLPRRITHGETYVDNKAVCPCQYGPCGHCSAGRHDKCSHRTWLPAPSPDTRIIDRRGGALTAVWRIGRACEWRCPCSTCLPHRTVTRPVVEITAVDRPAEPGPLTTPAVNTGCRDVDQLDDAAAAVPPAEDDRPPTRLEKTAAYVRASLDDLDDASTPSAMLHALADLDATIARAREHLITHLIADEGWSYAQVGAATGVTRQAANKRWEPVIRAAQQRRAHLHQGPPVITVRALPAAPPVRPEPTETPAAGSDVEPVDQDDRYADDQDADEADADEADDHAPGYRLYWHQDEREWQVRLGEHYWPEVGDIDAGDVDRAIAWAAGVLAVEGRTVTGWTSGPCHLDGERPAVEYLPQLASPDALVVIPCGGAKLDHPAAAGEMYVGSYHQACRRAADTLGGRVLILSAKYGLLDLAERISPYDLRMGDPGSITVAELRDQAAALGVDHVQDVTILAGAAYAATVATIWPHAIRPLASTSSMGEQLATLAYIAAGGPR